MTLSPLLIVGRGPSACGLERYRHLPAMAVSSGIFVFGRSNPPEHFATLDGVKFFQAGLAKESQHAWQHDGKAECWPFWADPDVTKHVSRRQMRPGSYRSLPPEIYDVIPAHVQPAFNRELLNNMHLFGLQPSWVDFVNVQGWDIFGEQPMTFTDDGRIGSDGVCNSMLFAVQVAYRLGYRDLQFLGCDMLDDFNEPAANTLRKFYPAAQAAGMDWVSLSPESRLNEFLPVAAEVTA